MSFYDNRRKIIQAFKDHKALAIGKLNFWTNGETIFSWNMPLVSHNKDGTLHWFYEGRSSTSITTRKHINFVEMELKRGSN